jgi:hypothetical protein
MKKELCIKLVIYKDYTEKHGQQNLKSTDKSIAAGFRVRQAAVPSEKPPFI